MKQVIYILTFTLLFFTLACESNLENDEIAIKENSTLNGDWTVNAYFDNGNNFGPFDLKVQTTADNDSISIKDSGDFWNFQVKAAAKSSATSFKSDLSINEISKVGANIKVLNGKIVENDSIYFEIQFEDDVTPYGITYQLKGHRK